MMSARKVNQKAKREIVSFLNGYMTENAAEHLQLLSEYYSRKIIDDIYCPLKVKEFHCPNPKCLKDRLDENGHPFATIKQLSIAEQLAHLITCRQFEDCLQYKASRDTTYHVPESAILSQNPNNINLLMYTDGFNPFKRGKVHMTLIMFIVFNLPPELRYVEKKVTQIWYKKKNIIIPTIIPGPKQPHSIHSFLHEIHKDLLSLQHQGMDVRHKGRQQHFTVSFEAIVGDIPACSAICGHKDHTAYYGCRICEAKAVAVPKS
ncbi:hypothetical protein G6F42_014014 [Rhizopus arrhizus]|nr:hypothetical protein G6F42_014014 [Rhizopus arrhizus]